LASPSVSVFRFKRPDARHADELSPHGDVWSYRPVRVLSDYSNEHRTGLGGAEKRRNRELRNTFHHNSQKRRTLRTPYLRIKTFTCDKERTMPAFNKRLTAAMMNRTKALVLALFAVYWVFVVVLLAAAGDVYDSLLPQPLRRSGNQRPAEVYTLLVLTALFAVLSTGVIRNWRWTFWLILVVFLAGILRVPAAALQLAGIVPSQGPAWYVALQAVVGLIQFGIALAMLAGYRKGGVWGAF
jgi:hypothetical protein